MDGKSKRTIFKDKELAFNSKRLQPSLNCFLISLRLLRIVFIVVPMIMLKNREYSYLTLVKINLLKAFFSLND